jgi:hypothetical protein
MNLGNVICGRMPFLVGWDSNEGLEPALLLMLQIFSTLLQKLSLWLRLRNGSPKLLR